MTTFLIGATTDRFGERQRESLDVKKRKWLFLCSKMPFGPRGAERRPRTFQRDYLPHLTSECIWTPCRELESALLERWTKWPICFIVEPLSVITASINIQKNKTRNINFFFLVTMQIIKPLAGDRPTLETVFSAGLKSLPPPSGEASTVCLLLLTVIAIAWFIITQESAGLISMDHIYTENKHIKPHYGFRWLAWRCARYIHSDDFIV